MTTDLKSPRSKKFKNTKTQSGEYAPVDDSTVTTPSSPPPRPAVDPPMHRMSITPPLPVTDIEGKSPRRKNPVDTKREVTKEKDKEKDKRKKLPHHDIQHGHGGASPTRERIA